MIEYNHAHVVAIVDYKKWSAPVSEQSNTSMLAIGEMADMNNTSFYIVWYCEENWTFKVHTCNTKAKTPPFEPSHIYSETEYVTWLYELRGLKIEDEWIKIHVLDILSTNHEWPTKEGQS
jgi:hypothetical protein